IMGMMLQFGCGKGEFPPVLADTGLCKGGRALLIHLKRLFPGRRVTQTQSSVKAFSEGWIRQMNDWSRLAVDLNETPKNRGRINELHEYKYAPIRGVKGTSYQRA